MSYTPAFAPMAQECLDDLKACNEKPIGNGPYQMAEPWKHNDSHHAREVRRLPGRRTSATPTTIEFKIVQRPDDGLPRLAGRQPRHHQPRPDPAAAGRGSWPATGSLQEDNGSFSYLGFPLLPRRRSTTSGSGRRCRWPSTGRRSSRRSSTGAYTPATDVIAPFVPGSRDDACEFCVYDPEEAKRLYDEAGGLPGDTVEIWFNNDGGHEQWIQAVAKGWKQRPRPRLRVRVASRSRRTSPRSTAEEHRRPVPARLDPGLPVAGELPRPALRRGQRQLRHRMVRSGARRVPRAHRGGRRGTHRSRRASRPTRRPRTSSWRSCR